MVPRADTEPTGIPCDDVGGNVHLARRGSRVGVLPGKEQMAISCHDWTL